MGTPQIIWIVIASLSLFLSLIKHGEDKGKFSFWNTLFAVAIDVWILSAGGFFGK